jgi:hypothetical protein
LGVQPTVAYQTFGGHRDLSLLDDLINDLDRMFITSAA